MKYQVLFSKNFSMKKYSRLSSAVVVIGTLRVKTCCNPTIEQSVILF